MAVIETNQLSKYYGRARGVIDLDLAVGEEEVFGFIGPNGAGKSTTIRTLLGLISPTSGRAQVLGLDAARHKKEILAQVGYMPGEANFYNGMRVGEILRYSAKLRGMDCGAEAERLCARLELDVRKKVEELSLGNRKKVSIVCAMQHRPRLYILDEPTSGLDPLMQKAFFELLAERNGEGATIFLSSHVLSEIQRHCTRAAIIREGRLVACDKVENLQKTRARRVTLHGAKDAPALDGVRDVEVNGEGISFLYQGDMQALVGGLSALSFTDLTITEPDLEEIFLHFYEKEGAAR